MILDEKGQIIGEFCFRLLRKNIGTFDIKIGEMKKQGQGYGYQSVLQGITYMTQTLTINCVEINVAPENKRAMCLYLSLGFKEVKRLKDNWIDGLGNSRDTVIYQLHTEEFSDK